MPSAQVINFGEDPYANAMGGFAKSFLGELDKRSAKRRNDELFESIKSKYGKDAPIEDILRDITMAEGFDQDYKNDVIKNVKDYAELKAKKDRNRYEDIKLDLREKEHKERTRTNDIAERRLDNEKSKVDERLAKDIRNLSKAVNDYNSKFLKDSGIDMSENDRADLNYFTEDLMNNQNKTLTEASRDAFKLIGMRREKINDIKVTPRPSAWFGNSDVPQAMEQALMDVTKLYEEDGIDNQKDLKAILKRGKWEDEEIKNILQSLFQSQGRKLRVATPKQSAEIPYEKQGAVKQAASVDQILFGD